MEAKEKESGEEREERKMGEKEKEGEGWKKGRGGKELNWSPTFAVWLRPLPESSREWHVTSQGMSP